MNVIGLGRAGCQVAQKFEKHDQYSVICVDTENAGYGTFLPVEVENSHEDYEKNYKSLNLGQLRGETTLVLSGAGQISGCALRLLEEMQAGAVSVIYIKADESLLSDAGATRDKIVFGVLQNYARSNKIKAIYVISNKNVESIIGDVSIMNYWDEVNNVISSTYHMINVFDNTEPLLKNASFPKPTSKIGTFGVVNFDTQSEKLFYDLKFPRSKNYFYGVNKETLEGDKKVLHKIRSFVESKNDDKCESGFSIYSTDYDNNYVYSLQLASYVQEENSE
jgi:hypothetical protein